MNKAGGFITLHRKILDWEWYWDTNTVRLFIHLLLSANFENHRFQGMEVKRGQFVTSLPSLSSETGLSIRQTRTALEHLISTGEVTNNSYTKYRVITIVKYDEYQSNRQTKRQTKGRRTTDKTAVNRQQYNNDNKYNKENNETNKPLKGFTPPTPDEVRTYCQSVGLEIDADRFCDFYGSNGWRVGKNAMKDWRAAARNWARRDRNDSPAKPAANGYSQRDYLSETEAALERMMSGEGF